MKLRRLFLFSALMLVFISVPAYAARETQVSIGKLTAAAGDEVSVPITIQNNTGVAMADLKVEYDSAVFTLLSVENGAVFQASELMESYSTNPYPILFVSITGNRTNNGTLVTLHFRVNAGCAAGTYPIRFHRSSMLSDIYETVLPARFTDGSVTVGGAHIAGVTQTSGGAVATVSCTDASASVCCASFNEAGQMLGIGMQRVRAGESSYTFTLGSAARFRVFVLKNGTPLCSSIAG